MPRDDEIAFTAADVAILGEVGSLMAADVASAQLVGQMSRVIGSSMARIASAQVDVLSARLTDSPRTGALADAELSDDQIVLGAGVLLPIVPSVLTATWRRHLQGAIRRRLSIAEAGHGQLGVVGFADLVGFTALSQQVGDDELAVIVDEFERLAFDVVTASGGRVVKMIGDEVMFTVDSPEAAAEIGLALAESTRGADELSEVRVGMAYGPLLEREGDLYGPVVNLASRITAIAYPGSIVVGPTLREQLADHEAYRLRSMRPRSLKDIGRVPLWVLRRSAPGREPLRPAGPRSARRGAGPGRAGLIEGRAALRLGPVVDRARRLPTQRTRRKKVRSSSTNVAGCSKAAKCPPRASSCQWRMSGKRRSAQRRDGRGHLLREDRAARGHVDRRRAPSSVNHACTVAKLSQ